MHMHILVYFLKKILIGSSLNSGLKLSNPKMLSQASLYMYYIISFITSGLPNLINFVILSVIFLVQILNHYFSYEKLGEQLEPKEGQQMETSGPQLAL